jgi:tetratricopeptide (TPR) repeat protein
MTVERWSSVGVWRIVAGAFADNKTTRSAKIMLSPATFDRQTRGGVVIWSFVAVVMSMTGRQTLAQNGHEWAGKRVVPNLNTVFRADEASVAAVARGNSKSLGRIYRVTHVNGSLLLLEDEETGTGCDATAEAEEAGEAINDQGEAVRVDSSAAASFNKRGAAAFGRGQTDQAIADYTHAIGLDPKYAAAYFNRALARRAAKDYDQAIADYAEALRLDPEDGAAYYSRANVWSDKHDFDKAIADYGEAIRLDSKNEFAYYNRALAWRAKNNFDKAIADYSEAIRLAPNDAMAYYNRAFAWRAKQDLDKAIADYGEAIRLDHNDSFSYYNRGMMLATKKDYDKASADFSEAIRLDPDDAHSHAARGKIWTQKRQFNKAIADFDEVVRLEPLQLRLRFLRSVCQMIVRSREAPGDFQAILELEGGKGPLSAYAVIFGHFAARLSGDDAKAGELLDAAPEMLDRGAWPYPAVKLLRGEIGEGEFLAAATDNDRRTEVRCYLGLDRLLKGQKDLALDHFRWVREHGTPEFFEYTVAVAEIKRLEKPNAKSAPAQRGGQ